MKNYSLQLALGESCSNVTFCMLAMYCAKGVCGIPKVPLCHGVTRGATRGA